VLDPITRTIDVPCDQETAFRAFVEGMPKWWPLDKRAMSLYSGQAAKSLHVDAVQGGRIVETSENGTEFHWGTITSYTPFELVRMDFHMGMPAENASVVEVTFVALSEINTRVTLTQSNWEAFGDMAQMMYDGYGSSWQLIFDEAYGAACGRTIPS